MYEPYFLDGSNDVDATYRPWVCVWNRGGGIDIEAPGCGTASLSNEEAKRLLRWLIQRYTLDALADV